MAEPRIYNLPVIPEAAFNQISAELLDKKAFVWTDSNHDGAIAPTEITGNAAAGFTPTFEAHYRRVAERFRQNSVAKELSLTYRNTITTDLNATLQKLPKSLQVTQAEIALYKRGIAKLMQAAPFIQQIFEQQVGYSSDLKTTPGLTANDKELIARYTIPWCLSNTSETCTALPTFAARQGSVLASDIDCKELGEVMTGPLSPFVAVTKENGKLKTTPYATQYEAQLKLAAIALREAAEIFKKIPRENVLAQYLVQLADDFSNTSAFPYVASNALWINHQKSDSIIYARIGPDEDSGLHGGDHCRNKAAFHFSIGLKNFESVALTTEFEPSLQKWEDQYAALVGDPKLYTAKKVSVLLPDFLDILYQNGDDTGGPNGTAIGQTLPNWCGADGLQEPCVRRTMIYANKSAQAYDKAALVRYVMPLFHPSQRQYLRSGSGNFKATVLHELAHNLGPQSGKPKPGTDISYQAPLKSWGGMIEEFKAQMGALYFPTLELMEKREAAKSGKLSAKDLAAAEDAYKHDMINTVSWSLSHILRATRTGAFKSRSPYSQLSAATVGYFVEQGAMQFDAATKTWKLEFDQFPTAVTGLAKKVVGMYARGDFKEVDDFMNHYLSGPGYVLLHTDRLQEVAGKKPSVIFSYKIKN